MNARFKYIREDLSASLVVFLVAIPLCLGIAVASGAPPLAGMIAGIVGGVVVGFFSGSPLSVSGPAAGLTAIVLSALETLDSYQMFLLAVVIAGILQVIMGALKAGVVGYFFPNSVIKGMLAAIGLILILKQIPHGLGYDAVYEGSMEFDQADKENTFSEIVKAFQNPHYGAVIVTLVAMAILLLFERPFMKKFGLFKILPGALFAVLSGVVLNAVFGVYSPELFLEASHLVDIPVFASSTDLLDAIIMPDWSALLDKRVYLVAVTIALIASIETLLSIEAADKLDPLKRITPASRELGAQGIGNIVSGLVGGIPVTAVIVRSSANINAGGRTKISTITHGLMLAVSLVFFAVYLKTIPLAALAAVLLLVGYKLVKPKIIVAEWKKGFDQFIPFAVTITVILFTDLLVGIAVGTIVGLGFVLKTNFYKAITIHKDGLKYVITLRKDVSFLNKAKLFNTLSDVPEESTLHIDVHKATFVDLDIRQALYDFIENAPARNIKVIVNGLERMERTHHDEHHTKP
jgi:MFS superfamily sulfate permease-like transporter